jgi:cold shock CspA family protein
VTVGGVEAGAVEAFDDHRGYGTIRRLSDGAEVFFHCTAIADGTRTIALGQAVCFTTAPGHLGRVEARGVEKV